MPIAPEADEIAGDMLRSVGTFQQRLARTGGFDVIGDFPQELPKQFLKGCEIVRWDATRGNGTTAFVPKVGTVPNTSARPAATPSAAHISPGSGYMLAGHAIGQAWAYYYENGLVKPREASEIQEDLGILIAATVLVASQTAPKADALAQRARVGTQKKTATKTASRRTKIHGVTRA